MSGSNTTQLRDALAWATADGESAEDSTSNPFVWFWEAIEGDFNERRSTAQILVDAGISMIPLVDQVCDIRDLIANCRKLNRDPSDKWSWIALLLTLIGLYPTLGSLLKGVLKIFFGFIRRADDGKADEAIDAAMTWVTAFIRRREVQKYLRGHKVDEVFSWLASEARTLRAKIAVRELIVAFDRAINVVTSLVSKVESVPLLGGKAERILTEVKQIRSIADAHLARALEPVQRIIDKIIRRLEGETLHQRRAIVDLKNVHFRGILPESAAVALMRKRSPKWLTHEGRAIHPEIKPEDVQSYIDLMSAKTRSGKLKNEKDIFPTLTEQNIKSFSTLIADTIAGPAKLYRILSPNSRAMGDCWVTEEVFTRLQASPDPKAAWRKYLAVWPDWNVNGQFVIYDVKAGESLNVWRGTAASQFKKDLPDCQLEGGYEQIVFNLDRHDHRNDGVRLYKLSGGKNQRLGKAMTQTEVEALTAAMTPLQKKAFYNSHLAVRESINHPNISGPFETGWGYTEFDGAGMASRIGLPALPGQIAVIRK